MPTTYNNGIYVVLDDYAVHRYLCHHGALSLLADTTVDEELISMLATNSSNYEYICDYIGTLSELEDGENFGIISEEQVSEVIDKALKVVATIMENDDIMGELLYADILNVTNIPDDGTANFFLQLMNNVNDALKAPLHFRELLFRILHKCEQYDDVQKWFAECVLTETELFRRSYQMEYINHHIGSAEMRLSEPISSIGLMITTHSCCCISPNSASLYAVVNAVADSLSRKRKKSPCTVTE